MQPMHPGASGSQTAHKGSHLLPSQPGSHLHPHFADLEIAQSGGSIYMYLSYLVRQSGLLRNIETHFRIFPAFSCAGLVDKLELLLQDPQKHLLGCSSLEFSRAAARL